MMTRMIDPTPIPIAAQTDAGQTTMVMGMETPYSNYVLPFLLLQLLLVRPPLLAAR